MAAAFTAMRGSMRALRAASVFFPLLLQACGGLLPMQSTVVGGQLVKSCTEMPGFGKNICHLLVQRALMGVYPPTFRSVSFKIPESPAYGKRTINHEY